jgi:cation:H+ antiporter
MLYITGFLLCALVIFFAGRQLSKYGDLLAEHTGWGKAWVGLILMASITSLPELMVGISSVTIVKSADLAVGDILGSCAFNLGILAMLDAFVPRRQPIFSEASPNHIVSAALGIILLTLAGAGLFLPDDILLSSILGIFSVIFIVVYLVSIRIIFLQEQKVKAAVLVVEEVHVKPTIPFATVVRNYIIFAFIIILAALALPYFADHLAESAGLNKSFVGTLFLAASTSLPEIAVSIAAVRMGALDMAVGGLLGSNIFNILILSIDDVFFTGGPLLKEASDSHLLSVLATIIMSAIVIIGLSIRPAGKRYKLGWDALLIFFVFFLNLILLYNLYN